jgi:hypothetical protein
LAVAPAADDTAVLFFAEAGIAELGFELVELAPSCDFDDDIDVISRADWRRRGVRDPQPDGGSADEHDLVDKPAERRLGKL